MATISVNEWLDQFIKIQKQRDITFRTVQEKIYIANFIRKKIGNRPMDIIRTLDLFIIIDEVWQQKKQNKAVRTYLFIKQSFHTAWSRGVIENNPAARLERPICKVKRERLELDEFLKILKIAKLCAPEYLYIGMLTALVTGRRPCEVVNITIDDIENDYLNVRTAKSGVIVSMPLDLKLEAIGTSIRDLFVMTRGKKYLVESDRRNAKVSSHSLTTWFSKMREAAGVFANEGRLAPSFYEIRSLSALLYNEQGLNINNLLGHRSLGSTKIYTDRRGKGVIKYIVGN